jgi:hypothetical protein
MLHSLGIPEQSQHDGEFAEAQGPTLRHTEPFRPKVRQGQASVLIAKRMRE